MEIKFNQTAEDIRREWAGEPAKPAPFVRPVLKAKRDHFALIVLAVVVVAALVAVVVL